MSEKVGNVIRLVGLEGVTAHGLRKFWEQNMHVEKLAYQKQMNGRALTEVERAYFWKETPELFDMYRANYHNLTIEKQEFREVEERLRRGYDREMKALRDRIYDLEQKNLELKHRLNDCMHALLVIKWLNCFAESRSLKNKQKTACMR